MGNRSLVRWLVACAALCAATILWAPVARADTLGLEIQFPDIAAFENLVYNSDTDLFQALGRPQNLNVDGSTTVNIYNPQTLGLGTKKTFALNVLIGNDGTLLGGTAGDDLLITGRVTIGSDTLDGVLLTGEVNRFAFAASAAPNPDVFEFLFDITGGLLEDLYQATGPLAGVVISGNTAMTEATGFSISFATDLYSPANANIFAVPEPSGLLALSSLAAAGTVLGCGRWRRRTKSG